MSVRSQLGTVLLWVIDRIQRRSDVAHRMFADVVADQTLAMRPDPSHGDVIEFIAFAKALRHLGRAQLLQDLWVLYETSVQQGGYFVEFGAADGIVHSNTLTLEQCFGWKGLLAEPNPVMAKPLGLNRTAQLDTRCVWVKEDVSIEFLVTEDPEYSTIASEAPDDIHAVARSSGSYRVKVPTVTLNNMLDEHQAPSVIDYMSIDTEGTELTILKEFDFTQRSIRLMTVEHNHRPDEAELDELLASKGFERRFPELSGFDAWYVHRSARPA